MTSVAETNQLLLHVHVLSQRNLANCQTPGGGHAAAVSPCDGHAVATSPAPRHGLGGTSGGMAAALRLQCATERRRPPPLSVCTSSYTPRPCVEARNRPSAVRVKPVTITDGMPLPASSHTVPFSRYAPASVPAHSVVPSR